VKPCEAACTYQLHIRLRQSHSLTIGKLGTFEFPAGTYIYTGSARRNMAARIERHLRREKRLRWHIDYLITCPDAEIVQIDQFNLAECQLNQATAGRILIPGFGASDCRNRCGSHLKYLAS